MPPPTLVDLASIDLSATVFDRAEIEAQNPQRFEMAMLDRIVHYDTDAGVLGGVKQIRDDEFWVRGHFPERPVLPGVMMLEAAAQLASFYMGRELKTDKIIGFAAADHVRFRRTVHPGDQLLVLGETLGVRRNVAKQSTQGFVGNDLVFEATITGMIL
ncbi:MAG: 3-hydroxyacyl-ACP dehydratase FabZ family protein [Planctomycetota bacterium]